MSSTSRATLAGLFVLVLAIIAAITWYFDHQRSRYSNLGIARHYFTHYQPAEVDSLILADSTAEVGWQWYGQKTYDSAIVQLAQTEASDPSYSLARLCIGVSLLALGDTEQGISTLDGIYLVTDRQKEVSWYLILGYLAAEEEALARYHLEELAADSTDRPAEVDQILDDLGSIWRM